ncbi:MAG: CHAT domain-containing protein [Pirellulaceae bacterium]
MKPTHRRSVPVSVVAAWKLWTVWRSPGPLVLALLGTFLAATAAGQVPTRGVPSDEHFAAFSPYLNGDFNSARRLFESSSRIKSTEGVWIDSIPYHTMIGECMYQMGNLAGALDQYSAALQVYLRYQDWLLRINVPNTVGLSTRVVRNPPTWGVPGRPLRLAQIPESMGSRQGNTDEQNALALQQGGTISMPTVVLINAKEIVRCTVVALRRRAEILGPAGEHDALSNQMITALSRRPAPPNNWTQAWISVQLGLAYAAKGKDAEAVAELKQSLLVAGMDHNLTSTALLELGKLAFRTGDFAAAGTYFLEATYSATLCSEEDYTQYEIMAEAFRWAMITHLVTGKQDLFQPLGPAVDWARRSQVRLLEASVLLSAAENCASLGDAARGGSLLERAAVLMRRRECGQGELGARFQYVSAHLFYLRGDVKRGAAALADAVKFAKAGGSRRLFQIVLVDRLFGSGGITTRQADLLYAEVLRDPTRLDWAMDPLETLAVLIVPHFPAYEHWMLLALDRKEKDVALRISDALRRHRFYTSLPLGGRLLNLRWVLESSPESLTETARLQRQDLRNRYPEYAQLSQEAEQLRAELTALSVAPKEAAPKENGAQQQRLAAVQSRLTEIGEAQERILWAIGLGREPGEFVFPPTTDVTVVQQQLQPRQRILVFAATSKATYAFLLGKENYANWQLEAPSKIKANCVKLLRDFGQFDRNQPLGIKELTGVTWKETAAEILQQLTGNAPPEAWDEIEELIIVPDGLLWYVPFEALQISSGAQSTSLIEKVRIRYVPTVSLAVPDNTPRKRDAHTAVVVGEIFAKSNTTAAQEVVTQLQADDPNVFAMPLKPTSPSAMLAKSVDRLVVLNDLENDAKGPYDWSPLPTERGKAAGSLAQWMLSPWGGPDQVVLPGFHTPAETALKRGGTGEEMFLAVCGFMSTGSRTLLLSRWRDGGRTSYDLAREFVRELPHRSASDAWQRSVRLALQSELDISLEPRVKSPPTDMTFKAEHPFFWSGYLLVDTGVEPK